MSWIRKSEIYLTGFGWFFILFGIMSYVFCNRIDSHQSWEKLLALVLLICAAVYNIARYYTAKSDKVYDDKLFILFRFAEIILISTGAVYLGIRTVSRLCLTLAIVAASLRKGGRYGMFLASASLVIHFLLLLPAILFELTSPEIPPAYYIADVLFYGLIVVILAYFCDRAYGEIRSDLEKLYDDNKRLEESNVRLEENNIRLDESNKKLKYNLAEFYTLQQVGEAISSILDTEELLRYVNDIIIGIMGVSSSIIALYDEKEEKLKVHVTNITDPKDLQVIGDNINCPLLLDAVKNSHSILDNTVLPDKYVFTRGRNINSLICVPLNTKSRRYGLVLIEHNHRNAFNDGGLKLLMTIGKQVGVALENAELYKKMQALATIDGLTGIHNRLYFEDRLSIELQKAKNEGYPLTVVMFDIDYFKRFNDTYGHLFGDKVLKAIVDLIGESLNSSEVFSRYGGEEFFIILPRVDSNEAYVRMDELRQMISEMVVKDNLVSATVTLSFGIASYPKDTSSEQELVHFADEALYQAKASGRNRVCVFRKQDYYRHGQEYLI